MWTIYCLCMVVSAAGRQRGHLLNFAQLAAIASRSAPGKPIRFSANSVNFAATVLRLTVFARDPQSAMRISNAKLAIRKPALCQRRSLRPLGVTGSPHNKGSAADRASSRSARTFASGCMKRAETSHPQSPVISSRVAEIAARSRFIASRRRFDTPGSMGSREESGGLTIAVPLSGATTRKDKNSAMPSQLSRSGQGPWAAAARNILSTSVAVTGPVGDCCSWWEGGGIAAPFVVFVMDTWTPDLR